MCLTVDPSITILVGLPDHLINLVVGQLLSNRGHDVTELSGGDKAVVITVENLESLSDLLFGVSVLHLAGHHGEELCTGASVECYRVIEPCGRLTGEVDGAVVVSVDLVDHVLKLRLAGVLAEGSHDSAQLLGGDLSCRESCVSMAVLKGWQ